ncbi:MAG: Phosphoglucosamine mutase [Eubacteriales bacterium SKADARSKE-1]|nr:Phosphoglucosamine mutase [Eubacteriales bacterium SKADARSKE-1]
MGRLFGTDGVRGVANADLTPELAMNISRASTFVLTKNKTKRPKVLVGKDTRLSSDMLEGALIAGFCSVGADVVSLGVVPTPAVAYLVKKYKADAGVMISASHNTYEFNGIKIFSGDGYKLPDALEEEIEAIVLDGAEIIELPYESNIGKIIESDNATRDYVDYIKSTTDEKLNGLKIAFDCSNGSASRTAEKLFEELGVECFMLHNKPDGININKDCGSVHLKNLVDFVKENNLDAGIAFDGDADRCLAVDDKGNIIDGDFIMAICAENLKEQGKLAKDTVVGTIMANIGFNCFCEKNGINLVSADVGDRYVLENMLMGGYNFGGEQSGHVIFLDFATTGDGQLTATQLLSIMKRKNTKLSDLSKLMVKYPQVMINVNVSQEGKLRFYTDDVVKAAIERAKNDLCRNTNLEKDAEEKNLNAVSERNGRILVRASGTEPLIRVMLEGENCEEISRIANEVADVVRERLSN